MTKRKFQLILVILLVSTLVTTVAYAYVSVSMGASGLQFEPAGGEVDSPGSFTDGKPEPDASLQDILKRKNITGPIPNLEIVVDKSDHTLSLYSGQAFLKSFRTAFGEGGLQPKQKAGDRLTPEGEYYITERLLMSPADEFLGTRWLRVSYPNAGDAERGLAQGLIDRPTYEAIISANNSRISPPQRTGLGGGIGIHGGSGSGENQGDFWTWGCVGLTDVNIEEFYEYIPVGTRLIIKP